MIEEALQTVTRQPHAQHIGFARAFVLPDQMAVIHAAPKLGCFTGLQYLGEFAHISQAQVQAQAGQRVDGVGSIACQHPSATLGETAAPLIRFCQLQRPDLHRRSHFQCAQGLVAGMGQGLSELSICQGLEAAGLCAGQGPNHSSFMPLPTAHGQQGQDVELAMCLRKPLQGLLVMWFCAANPGGQGVLLVGQGVERHAQFLAGVAVAAFTDHGQFGVHGLAHAFNRVLKIHRFAQHVFQHWHIHDVSEAVQRGRLKLHLSASVTPDLHALHRGGMQGSGPTAQITQQFTCALIEGESAHVLCNRWGTHQGHTQALPRQQQRQAAADQTTAAYAHIEVGSHMFIVGVACP